MIPSLQDLCLQEISQNTGFYQNSALPNSLSDEFAKLSFDTGVLESDLTLIAGVTTLNAKFPLTPQKLKLLFDLHRSSLQVLALAHSDFRGIELGDKPFSELYSFTLIKPRNLSQAQFNTLCTLFPRTMDTLTILECDNIHPDMQLLPNVKNLIITHVEAHNAGLELSVDE